MPTVTVGCKLPNGIVLHLGEKEQMVNGSNSSLVIGGHGITEDVDKVFFDAWMKKNAKLKFVKDGLIFAHEETDSTKAEAKEKADVKTGLEPLDTNAKPDGITEVK